MEPDYGNTWAVLSLDFGMGVLLAVCVSATYIPFVSFVRRESTGTPLLLSTDGVFLNSIELEIASYGLGLGIWEALP